MKYIATLAFIVLLARPVVAQETIDVEDMIYLVEATTIVSYPVEGVPVSRFLASRVEFEKNGDTSIVPGTWLYLPDSIIPILSAYLAENQGAFLFAPKSRVSYGIRRDGGSTHMVMAYGRITRSLRQLSVPREGDDRLFGYLIFEHPILYRDTMLMWNNIFGWFEDEKPIMQTAAIVVEKTRTGAKLSSAIVSCEPKDIALLEAASSHYIEYAKMMFIDEKSEPILAKDTPYTRGPFHDKVNASRTVWLAQSVGVIGEPNALQPVASSAVQPIGAVAEQAVPVLVVEEKEVSVAEAAAVSKADAVSMQIAVGAPKVLNISDGVQFTPDQSSTTVSWAPVAGATIYRVRIVASDNSRDNTHLRTSPEMKFQLLRPGVSYEVSITPEDNNRHVVGPVYTVSFTMSEK